MSEIEIIRHTEQMDGGGSGGKMVEVIYVKHAVGAEFHFCSDIVERAYPGTPVEYLRHSVGGKDASGNRVLGPEA